MGFHEAETRGVSDEGTASEPVEPGGQQHDREQLTMVFSGEREREREYVCVWKRDERERVCMFMEGG